MVLDKPGSGPHEFEVAQDFRLRPVVNDLDDDGVPSFSDAR